MITPHSSLVTPHSTINTTSTGLTPITGVFLVGLGLALVVLIVE